jgi:hypothetical protein
MRKSPSPPRGKKSKLESKLEEGLPNGKVMSAVNVALLRKVASEHSFVLFGVYQIAHLLQVRPTLITAVANDPNTPFVGGKDEGGKKARPEWVTAFLKKRSEAGK